MAFDLRIAHVSDLHLTPRDPARLEQADHLAESLRQTRPHVVVVTGDLTDDGWDRQSDLIFARDWLNCLGLPWRAVPGNHDVGNFANQPEGPINQERLASWQEVFAPAPGRVGVRGLGFDGSSKSSLPGAGAKT